jgi:hypothetical protein
MICGFPISEIVTKLCLHFLLACAVGVPAYLLTSTTLSHISYFRQQQIGVFSIQQYSLLVALCCVLLSHIAEDFIFHLF